jgi:hypothetical protein
MGDIPDCKLTTSLYHRSSSLVKEVPKYRGPLLFLVFLSEVFFFFFNSAGLLSIRALSVAFICANCAQENPLCWGALQGSSGSNADKSQILAAATGVENKAIIFAMAFRSPVLAGILTRERVLGKGECFCFHF